MVAVVAKLVEHELVGGVHLHQPLEAPLGFVQHIGAAVAAVQAIGLLSIGKYNGEIAVCGEQVVGRIGRGGDVLQVVARIVPSTDYVYMRTIGHGAIERIAVVGMAAIF